MVIWVATTGFEVVVAAALIEVVEVLGVTTDTAAFEVEVTAAAVEEVEVTCLDVTTGEDLSSSGVRQQRPPNPARQADITYPDLAGKLGMTAWAAMALSVSPLGTMLRT